MRRIRVALALIVALLCTVVPPMPAQADLALLTLTGNPLTAASAPYLVLTGLAGQSACALTINTAGGAMAVEGLYKGTTAWTPALTTVSPDGTATQTTETAAGSYVFNCATMVAVRVDGTAATGTPSVTLNAGGGINRILGAGVNGGRTIVAGNSPITVTNSGNTATISCTGCGAGPSPTPVSVQAGTGIAVATPSPGVFVVSSTVTPSPTSTPVSVTSGSSNVAVATPAPGVFSVSVAPPTITGTGGTTVTNPSFNTFVVASSPVPSPAPTVSITSTNANTTVTNPSTNVFTLTTVTPAPAPTVAITSTTLNVTNPSTNVFTVDHANAYTAPYASPTFGCDSYIFQTGTTYSILGDGYSCTSVTANTFVIPAVGAIVSVPVIAGFSVYQKYTPVTISDGTNMVGGYVTAATTPTSTALSVFVGRINFGVAGNTVASGAEIVTGGYDVGAGSGTLTAINAGSNIVVTNPAGPAPTVAVTASPLFSNVTIATNGNLFIGVPSVGSVSSQIRIGAANGNTYSNLAACPTGTSACLVSSIYGTSFDVNNGVNSQFVVDTSGNAAAQGAFYASNLVSGNCLQAAASGKITSVTAPCVTSVTGGPGVSITGSGTATVTVNQTISVNGAAPATQHAPEIFSGGTAIANGGSRTYTFFAAFANTSYSCTALQSAAGIVGALGGNSGLFAATKTTTAVTITNNTGAAQTPDVTCNGI